MEVEGYKTEVQLDSEFYMKTKIHIFYNFSESQETLHSPFNEINSN